MPVCAAKSPDDMSGTLHRKAASSQICSSVCYLPNPGMADISMPFLINQNISSVQGLRAARNGLGGCGFKCCAISVGFSPRAFVENAQFCAKRRAPDWIDCGLSGPGKASPLPRRASTE